MKMFACSLIFIVGGILSACAAQDYQPVSEIPANIPTCSQKDENLNECLRSAFQEMMPRLKNGLKEFNIAPVDPFIIEKSSYQFANGVVQGRVALRNTRIYGMSDAIIDKVNLEVKDDKTKMILQWRVPNILIEGNYKAEMKLNDIKMTPKGYFNVSMSNLKMLSEPEGELVERNGQRFVHLNKFNMVPEVGDMKIYASGLFPDPTLNAVVLDFVNQYWRQIYKAMLPETRATWEPLMIRYANEFLSTVPFDLLITKN